MPTATNNIDNKNNGYSKIVAHVTRQYPNDSNNKHIEKELTKYNQTFFITNFDKQLSKNVPNDYIKEHDKKAIARRHKKDVWGSKKNFLAEQKAKGNIEDKRLTATVGNHEYYDEIISRVAKLHPEMSNDEVMESVVNTYNRAFKSFAKGFNQTHENLVISRCDTNVDERPPHMHYQLTGMTVTAKGKPSFKFGAALHKTYSENEKTNVGNDYKAFRADADEMLVHHFKKAMVSEYGKEFNDIELERTGAPSGLSQEEREHLNDEVERATALRLLELKKREAKVKEREDRMTKKEENNNHLRYEKSKLTDERNKLTDEMSDFSDQALDTCFDMYDMVQDVDGTGYKFIRENGEDLFDEDYDDAPGHFIETDKDAYTDKNLSDVDRANKASESVGTFRECLKSANPIKAVGKWVSDKVRTAKDNVKGILQQRDKAQDQLDDIQATFHEVKDNVDDLIARRNAITNERDTRYISALKAMDFKQTVLDKFNIGVKPEQEEAFYNHVAKNGLVWTDKATGKTFHRDADQCILDAFDGFDNRIHNESDKEFVNRYNNLRSVRDEADMNRQESERLRLKDLRDIRNDEEWEKILDHYREMEQAQEQEKTQPKPKKKAKEADDGLEF